MFPGHRSISLALLLGLAVCLVTTGAPDTAAAARSYDVYARNWPNGLHQNVHKYHLEQGREKLQRGSFHHAMQDAKFILTRFPNDPKGLQLAMEIALKQPQDDRAAIPYFEEALNQYPQHGETWLLYGIYLHRLGSLQQAVDAYRTAIERGGQPAEAHYNLGLALLDLGELSAARTAAQRAYDLGHPLPGLKNKLRSRKAWDDEDGG